MFPQGAIVINRQQRPQYRYGRPQDLFNLGNGVRIPAYGPPMEMAGGQMCPSYPPTHLGGARFGPAFPAAAYGSYIPSNFSSGGHQQGSGQIYSVTSSPGAGGPGSVGTGGGGGGPRSQSPSSASGGEIPLSRTNLYIRGLQPNTTDRDLVNLCQGFGKIISTKAIIDLETQTCKGYGFVDFESSQAAELAVMSLQSRGVHAQMAKQQERDVTNLYVANLPVHATETDLEAMFAPFGTVVSTRILRDQHGISRGVGFARMESRDKCEAIIQAFNGKLLPRHSELLTVKFADGGNKKKSQGMSRQWVNRTPDSMSGGMAPMSSYEQHTMMSPNGMTVPTALLASPTGVTLQPHGYSLATAAMTPAGLAGYHQIASPTAWLHPSTAAYTTPAGFTTPAGPYILQQHPMPAVISGMQPGIHHMDPAALLAAQMSHMHISAATGGAASISAHQPPTAVGEHSAGI